MPIPRADKQRRWAPRGENPPLSWRCLTVGIRGFHVVSLLSNLCYRQKECKNLDVIPAGLENLSSAFLFISFLSLFMNCLNLELVLN